MSELGSNTILGDATGSAPEITKSTLEVTNRTINSLDQAFQVCETMVNDAKKLILNSARITAKVNGERPYNQKRLKDALKDWKTNISTGFLATECRKIQPRLHMPLKTAKYLTSASLPQGWPDGEEKTQYFRQTITDTIRSWPKFNFYLRGLSREVSLFGYGFNAWFDEWEWRPTLLRMDKGFVPQGTEVMDNEPQFFMAKYDYKPDELLTLLKSGVDAGRTEWQKDNVVKAITGAIPPPVDASYPNARTYEELVRQSVWGWRYTKGIKLIRAWHLFAKEATGKVSHYIVHADGYASGGNVPASEESGSQLSNQRLLYEGLDEFDSMQDVVNTVVFDFGDGTVAGSWGAGQILYDLAAQVEKIRCDSIDNLRNTNKMKLQVGDAKNVNDVKLTVTDTLMIVSGAQFAGSTAAMPQDVEGYEMLDAKLTQIAQQRIGAFVPPIPLQPSDIKAAQINAALSKEKELQEDVLENWLIQAAVWLGTMTRRLCKLGSPDSVAQALQAKLLKKLTQEEVDILVDQFSTKSVIDFTEYKSQQQAAFAQSVMQNPLFRQPELARIMAGGVGDERFVDNIVLPDGDQSDMVAAQQKQLIENGSLALGQPTPILPNDNDWVHMQTLKPGLELALKAGSASKAQVALQHYSAHYAQGVAKKKIPDEAINAEKSYIAAIEKQIEALQKRDQIQQAHAAATQHAQALAQHLVTGGATPHPGQAPVTVPPPQQEDLPAE